MPKEIIHFLVAEKAADTLHDSPFNETIHRHQAALVLGAVFPDAFFYLTGRQPGEVLQAGKRLHGEDGRDTFDFLKKTARHAHDNPGAPRSFVVGLAAHLAADIVLHPMVFYHTGNTNTDRKAVERHRMLETVMDMAAISHRRELKRFPIRKVLRETNLDLLYPVDALAELAGTDEEDGRQAARDAFLIFAALQLQFPKGFTSRFAHWLKALSPRGLKEFWALFYAPQFKRHVPKVSGPIEYRDPVTGQQRTETLRELMTRAADKAVELCRALEPLVFEGRDVDIGIGPCLSTGIPGTTLADAVHFADTPMVGR